VVARAANPQAEDQPVLLPRTAPRPRNRAAFVLLWMTLGIVILVESVPAIVRVISGSPDANNHVALLAAVEVVGAILFLMPRSLRYGAWTLLAVFAVAIVAHLVRGEFPTPLFVYAVGTYYVLTLKGPRRSR
jgi:hypothetical protein